MFTFVYTEFFYKPLFNALVFFTNISPSHSLGLAIIMVTILVRLVLFPFQHKMAKTQTAMKKLEPELQKIKERYKNKKEEQARATMGLYKKHGVSPFSGIFMLLIQLPVLIALLRIFEGGLQGDISAVLYSFVSVPDGVNSIFLGIDLVKSSVVLAALAGLSQYFQIKLAYPAEEKNKQIDKSEKKESFGKDFQHAMRTQMQYVFPFIIFFIGIRFSAALTLYWTVMNIFAIVHESVVRRRASALGYE